MSVLYVIGMKIKIGITLLLWMVLFLSGCAELKIRSFTSVGEDSVNRFIVEALNDHGGNVVQPEAQELGNRWRHARDSEGVQVFLYDTSFSEVAEFLRLALGDPDTERGSKGYSDSIEAGGGWYSVRDKGVAASYWDEKGFVHLIIIRAQGSADNKSEHSTE